MAEFSVHDTLKAKHFKQLEVQREGERKLGAEAPFTDTQPPIQRSFANLMGDELPAGLLSHPVLETSPEYSDAGLSDKIPRHPDGSKNLAEHQHNLAMRMGKKFSPAPAK